MNAKWEWNSRGRTGMVFHVARGLGGGIGLCGLNGELRRREG